MLQTLFLMTLLLTTLLLKSIQKVFHIFLLFPNLGLHQNFQSPKYLNQMPLILRILYASARDLVSALFIFQDSQTASLAVVAIVVEEEVRAPILIAVTITKAKIVRAMMTINKLQAKIMIRVRLKPNPQIHPQVNRP